jgi:hypothetical protein
MRMKIIISVLIFLAAGILKVFPQTFEQPNYALKSHETLVIKKIEATTKATIFYMSVENRIEGGNFCADKNIFLIYPDGTRSWMISSTGIPVCPDTYKFKSTGEKLDFILIFPPLKQGTGWIDIIEDCNDNCFSFYGVTLNLELNKKIDEAFMLAESEEPVKALVSFTSILEQIDDKNYGIEGLLYVTIIKLELETGHTVKAAEWYNRLKSSGAPRAGQFIKNLNSQGIIY